MSLTNAFTTTTNAPMQVGGQSHSRFLLDPWRGVLLPTNFLCSHVFAMDHALPAEPTVQVFTHSLRVSE